MRERRIFKDRQDAGNLLGAAVAARGYVDAIVLALPRGGVPVAAKVAAALQAPLDLVFVRKIGTPGQPELAAAAVVEGGTPEFVSNEGVLRQARLTTDDIRVRARDHLVEIERRRRAYLGGRPGPELEGRTLVVVDDGMATGASMRAAVVALRRKHPRKLVLAVPVAPQETLDALAPLVDDTICLLVPGAFRAVGEHYCDFHQLRDAEVIELMRAARGA